MTTRYAVYLEFHKGFSMAHVLDLPGCFVRARSKDEALERLPQAMAAHISWLASHGDTAGAREPIEVEVAEEIVGVGPFDPGDAAAIFSPERSRIDADEVERFSRIIDRSRAELLALVRELSDDVLDRQASASDFSIRRMLRHVGNAEEGYVSKLVEAEDLPREWKEDEKMPIFEFLEMERRTTSEILRNLDQSQRSHTFIRTKSDGKTQEEWSARKVLRRFLEHEREHYAQILEMLSDAAI